MFTRIASRVQFKPVTPGSKKAMPRLYKTTGTLKTWGLSGMCFGIAGFVTICYVTEWRTVLQYLPYYNGKYSELEKKDKAEAIQEEANVAERKKNASTNFKQEREDKLNDDKNKQ